MVMHPATVTDRLLARLFSTSLDRRLAHGETPESGRLLASRAQQVVALCWRRELARQWEHLLEVAGDQPHAAVPAPLCRDRVLAAEDDVHDLAAHLQTPLPVPAVGVAAAHILLTDATGPLYNRRDRSSLGTRLRHISAQLDPGVPLQSLVRSNT
jgi:hypothetical protein